MSHQKPQSPLAESPVQKSCGFTLLLLQPQKLNKLLLSWEVMDIIKREEDAPSVPVGHMRVTLNKRAADPQLHESPHPYLLHCFTDHGLLQLGLLLSLPSTQNGSALAAVLPAAF